MMQMQTKLLTLEHPSLASMIDTSHAYDIIASQVSRCLIQLSEEMMLASNCVASESKRHRPKHCLAFSLDVVGFSKRLSESSPRVVSGETNRTGQLAINDETSLGTFAEGSDLGDDMDIDGILSILSEDMPTSTTAFSPDSRKSDEICVSDQTTAQLMETEASLTASQARLRQCMNDSLLTQAELQEWDRLNGLPASHSRTMVNTARSRKQLQDGVILKKWNGSPLLKDATGSVLLRATTAS